MEKNTVYIFFDFYINLQKIEMVFILQTTHTLPSKANPSNQQIRAISKSEQSKSDPSKANSENKQNKTKQSKTKQSKQ